MSEPLLIKPIIGSRASTLAKIQAQRAASALHIELRHLGIRTQGDKILNKYLRDLGGKDLFVRDIEQALLDKKIDLAIHSLKDMPATQPEGIMIAAILPREDVRDALVSKNKITQLHDLPKNATIGTASPRRAAQVKAVRADLNPVLLRGNVDTRLEKIATGKIDAALLAMAGLERLGRLEMAHPIATDIILPAAAQGVICIECRTEDQTMRNLCVQAHHHLTAQAVLAERCFTSAFGASCYVPIAALAQFKNGQIDLRAQLLTPDGSQVFSAQNQGDDPKKLGLEMAQYIASLAGSKLLQKIGVEMKL